MRVPKTYKVVVSYESGMIWLYNGTLIVPSASEAGAAYTIGVSDGGDLTCECVGARYWDRCRHVERAAYFLEHVDPKTASQEKFATATYRDPYRQAIRNGFRPEKVKRIKKSELEAVLV